MSTRAKIKVQMIPIDRISVVNPRARGQPKFKQIVANIAKLGLKRPITVAQRASRDGNAHFELVCGQGRLEAFTALGQSRVPAIVIDAAKEDCLLMSLAENLARRRFGCVETLKEIRLLKERGYSFAEIARKTDLDQTYVRGIIRLLKSGEERVLHAVETGKIPISIGITIASADDEAVQRALADAYENNTLRGKALMHARRLIEKRKSSGKRMHSRRRVKGDRELSSTNILRAYQRETSRQKLVIQKARVCETRLLFVVSALKQLFADESFVNLLRAEQLDTLPEYLAQRIRGKAE